MRYLIYFSLACTVGATGPVLSQSIDWEIAGTRFSPFETLANPSDTFKYWALEPGETLAEWHERVWHSAEDGAFVSPYGAALQGLPGAGEVPWDKDRQRHRDEVLTYVQNKDTPIKVRVWSDFEGPCTWSVEGGTERTAEVCSTKAKLTIPMSGATVTLSAGSAPIERELKPEHVVILGMGDSYASGEGNPDIPTRWFPWGAGPNARERPATGSVAWLRDEDMRSVAAKWLAPTCRRSFFSNQSLAALAYASESSKRYVSFLHYGCSGAEIFDGLLAPQRRFLREAQDAAFKRGRYKGARSYQLRSQLDSAVLELCRETPTRQDFERSVIDAAIGEGNKPRFRRQHGFDGDDNGLMESRYFKTTRELNAKEFNRELEPGIEGPYGGRLACSEDDITKPDIVLVGVGGNDIGFQGVVTYYVTPVNFAFNLRGRITGRVLPIDWGALALKGLAPEVCPGTAPKGNQVAGRSARRLNAHCNGPRRQDTWEADVFDGPHETFRIGAVTSSDLIYGQTTGPGRTRCASRSCGGIVQRYGVLLKALEQALFVPPEVVVMPTYPEPLRVQSETTAPACEPLTVNAETGLSRGNKEHGKHDYGGPFNAMPAAIYGSGFKSFLLREFTEEREWDDWEFNIIAGREGEAGLLLRQFEEMRQAMLEAQREHGFHLACEARDVFLGHHMVEGLHLALPNAREGGYAGPDQWRPYRYSAEPERAVRTGNDSFLTQFDGEDSEPDFQGTAHPNLTGHRLVAETLLPHIAKAARGEQP